MTLDEIISGNDAICEWSVLTAYRGSKTHGTQLPSNDPAFVDDIDVMAVVVPDIAHYYGLRKFGRQGTKTVMRDEWDIVIHECRKFVRMLSGCNPNVLPLLWLRPHDYIQVRSSGRELINHRGLFLTKALAKSTLPPKPDMNMVNELCIEVVDMELCQRGVSSQGNGRVWDHVYDERQ